MRHSLAVYASEIRSILQEYASKNLQEYAKKKSGKNLQKYARKKRHKNLQKMPEKSSIARFKELFI